MAKSRWFRVIALVAILCLPISTVLAHQLQVEPVAITLRPQETFITAEFEGNVQDITQIPNAMVEDKERTGDTFTEPAKKRIEAYIQERLLIEQNGNPLKGELTSVTYQNDLDPTKSKFQLIMRYAREGMDGNAPVKVTTRLFDYLPNAKTIINVGGFSRTMTPGETAEIDAGNFVVNLFINITNFFVEGINHILSGYDHLLFIFGLVLVSTSFPKLVKTLTGFTIAHSITLVLSTLSVVALPPKLVEIFVILSIIWVGIENIVFKDIKHRFWIASGFGLIHGFAFAQNLRDLGLPEGNALFWSLLSFNLGVEAGQVAVCAVIFPLLMLWKKKADQQSKYGALPWETIVKFASAGVIIGGMYFLISNVFGGLGG